MSSAPESTRENEETFSRLPDDTPFFVRLVHSLLTLLSFSSASQPLHVGQSLTRPCTVLKMLPFTVFMFGQLSLILSIHPV